MKFYIRYTTATHKGLDGPYRSQQAAHRAMCRKGEREWYRGRLACIVRAANSNDAMDADAIECA
jgi:hypothetical protein